VTERSKTGTIAFQPRARLLKLIGEELISDEIVAISELVKNSHDADATRVILRFQSVTLDEGRIEVLDDGCGMDVDTLLGRWMEPAASTKTGKGRQFTPRGRRVLGEKGVGRFAADKVARHLEIASRCARRKEEILASIDWDRFDTDDLMLAEVKNRWEVRPAREIRGHGTLLRMSGLRSTWSERMFRRLCIRLSQLLSPFRVKDEFAIRIESDEFPEYSGELRADFLEKAPYRVEAEYDGIQTVSIGLSGRCPIAHRWNGQGELACGPARIRLFTFDLDAEALAKIGPRVELRAWLREWTGVSVYRDGFRVWPYGEPHDDWLRLDQRRVNNPVEHLSNNQVIGFIEIGRDSNPDLKDQTNREGLMHNQAFEDLRRLIYFVFQAIEAERQSIRHPKERIEDARRAIHEGNGSVVKEFENLTGSINGKTGRALRRLKNKLEEQSGREAAEFKRALSGFSGLAVMGQMVAGLMPVIPHRLSQMECDVNRLQETLAARRIPEGRDALAAIQGCIADIHEFCRMMLAASAASERRRAIDIHAELESFRALIGPLLTSRGIELKIVCPDRGVFRTEMRPESFLCLLQVLATNSMDWLSNAKKPSICIRLSANERNCTLLFSDNGPGVPSAIADRIFEPLFTRREGARGMGLTVARQLVESCGGHIDLLVDGRRRGATFRIFLPKKRSRATHHSGR
jgi:signal transduction histidine kinase